MNKKDSDNSVPSSHTPVPATVFWVGAFSLVLGLFLYGSQALVSTPLWGSLMIKSWGLCIVVLGLYLIISGLVTAQTINNEEKNNLSLTECPSCGDLDLYSETEKTVCDQAAG